MRKVFRDAGEKLLEDHRRHMQQRSEVLSKLDGVLGTSAASAVVSTAPTTVPEPSSAPKQQTFAFSAPPGYDTFGSHVSFG